MTGRSCQRFAASFRIDGKQIRPSAPQSELQPDPWDSTALPRKTVFLHETKRIEKYGAGGEKLSQAQMQLFELEPRIHRFGECLELQTREGRGKNHQPQSLFQYPDPHLRVL